MGWYGGGAGGLSVVLKPTALADPALASKVEEERAGRRKKVLESDAEVQRETKA